MINKVYFGSTNLSKLNEARDILKLDIEQIELQVDEIQSLNPIEVASKKAWSYYEKFKEPLFVDDNSLVFNALNKLPGPYIGDFSKALNNKGLINLLSDTSNKNAKSEVVIAYIDQHSLLHIFSGSIDGVITSEPRGKNGFGWDAIFIPDGYTTTFAEMTNEEKNRISSRRLALDNFKQFLFS